jgi:hypothetical protein
MEARRFHLAAQLKSEITHLTGAVFSKSSSTFNASVTEDFNDARGIYS